MAKRLFRFYAVFVIIAFLVPSAAGFTRRKAADEILYSSEDASISAAAFPERISVYDTDRAEILNMDFEEYIIGVLAGEMPASYELEALKAQAVAARSYLKSKIGANSEEHHGADVCTDPNHCEAWLSRGEVCERWEDGEAAWEKFKTAAEETRGEYMMCGGETVRAFFHSTSHGRTEIPSDVWGGGEFSYLQSVDSPWDEMSPEFYSSAEFDVSELCTRLGTDNAQIGSIEHTVGGAVKTVEIGGAVFKGTEIRAALGLRSACFDISSGGESVTFSVRGFGHGVGMSQYGANCMAGEGKNYEEILKYYYTGIEIAK